MCHLSTYKGSSTCVHTVPGAHVAMAGSCSRLGLPRQHERRERRRLRAQLAIDPHGQPARTAVATAVYIPHDLNLAAPG